MLSQVAVPRKTNPKLVMRTKKIFVGGLSATTSLEDVKAYFEQFSKVKESMLAYDKVEAPVTRTENNILIVYVQVTNRHRGFGFVTFDNEDVVDKICEIHFHEINGELRCVGSSLLNTMMTQIMHHQMTLMISIHSLTDDSKQHSSLCCQPSQVLKLRKD